MKWLERFIDPEGNKPSDVIHRGNGYSIATDKYAMLAVIDPGVPNDPLANAGYQKTMKAIINEPVPASAMVAELPDLWAFLDRIERVPCPGCATATSRLNGVAYWEDREEKTIDSLVCQNCPASRGWNIEVSDCVTICGLVIERNLLAWWLAPELLGLGERFTVFVAAKWPRILRLHSRQWILAIMSIDPKHERTDTPRRTYISGAGAWWQCRHDWVARNRASVDWAEENGLTAAELWGEPEEVTA